MSPISTPQEVEEARREVFEELAELDAERHGHDSPTTAVKEWLGRLTNGARK